MCAGSRRGSGSRGGGRSCGSVVVARGELWWHDDPDDERRPYLVLTRNEGIPVLTRVLGVPATRNIRGISSEVRRRPAEGFPTECALSLDNIQPIRRSLLTERIGQLDDVKLRQVCDALAFASGCS